MARECILVIEDDKKMLDFICSRIEEEGMEYIGIDKGTETLATLADNPIDCIILDLKLPDIDGFDLLKSMREKHPALPIIIVSGKKKPNHIILGLELGADDYITKPFNEDELIARIRSHIRRSRYLLSLSKGKPDKIIRGNLHLDLKKCVLEKKGTTIRLSARLFRLLQFFMENHDKVIPKEELYKHAWDDDYFDDITVKVYIRKLRQLIEDNPESPQYIHTVWGFGYKFVC